MRVTVCFYHSERELTVMGMKAPEDWRTPKPRGFTVASKKGVREMSDGFRECPPYILLAFVVFPAFYFAAKGIRRVWQRARKPRRESWQTGAESHRRR